MYQACINKCIRNETFAEVMQQLQYEGLLRGQINFPLLWLFDEHICVSCAQNIAKNGTKTEEKMGCIAYFLNLV